MKVLRLEDSDGHGIFSSYKHLVSVYCRAAKVDVNPNNHPNIWVDKFHTTKNKSVRLNKRKNKYDYFCGFESFNQLKIWFPCFHGRMEMARKGCILKQFEFDDSNVLIGQYQVLFDHEKVDINQYVRLNPLNGKIIEKDVDLDTDSFIFIP